MMGCSASGWVWYCDVHDSHGNADFEAEAEHVSSSHTDFWDDPEGCEIVIYKIGKYL